MNYNNKINTYVIEMAQKDNYNQKLLLLFYFIYKNYNFVKKKVFQIAQITQNI